MPAPPTAAASSQRSSSAACVARHSLGANDACDVPAQWQARRGRCRAAHASRRLLTRRLAADWNPSRLRAWRVRRVHGHCRWGRGPLLPDAGGSGRRQHRRNRRGPLDRRGVDPVADRLPQASRLAVRLLHTRHVDHRACPVDRGTGCRRRPHPLGAVGQFVPMYRVHPDRRGGARSTRHLPEDRQAMIGTNRYIGSPVERIEDWRFLRGRGEFVGDLQREGMLHAAILRSPIAHGRLRRLDATAARDIPGVRAIITAAEIGTVPTIPLRLLPLPGTERFLQPVIAAERVRYVGEPIAVVLADSAALAEDGVEAIVLDIEELPPVADRRASGQHDILLFEESGTNLAMTFTATKGDADAVFREAAYVRRERFQVQRHTALPMEPRGVLAEWDAAQGRMTVLGAAKVPFFNRDTLAAMLGLATKDVDLIENDVGGGFRARGEVYPADFLIPLAAGHVGRPVG